MKLLFVLVVALMGTPIAGQAPYHPEPSKTNRRLSTTPIATAPAYYLTVGGGDQVPGHGAGFAYWSVSRYMGQQTYATAITEYSMTQGQVVTCPLAGVSHVVTSFKRVSFGLVGAGGGCSGDKGGSEAAGTAQGFALFRLKGTWSAILTARKTYTAKGTSAVRLTLGIGFGK